MVSEPGEQCYRGGQKPIDGEVKGVQSLKRAGSIPTIKAGMTKKGL